MLQPLLLGFIWVGFVHSSNLSSDAIVLLGFKRSISYGNTSEALPSWKWTKQLSSWQGVIWSSSNDIVLELNLYNLGLQGELWPFWCKLKSPRVIDLTMNKFTGTPLSYWCKTLTSSIKFLSLGGNRLTGRLPENMESNTLEELYLLENKFSGQIPQSFGRLRALKVCSMSSNKFSGRIPSSTSRMNALEIFSLSSNVDLFGEIEDVIKFLPKGLQDLYLDNTSIGGSLPDDICRKFIPNITYLALSSMKTLTGKIPKSLSRCTRLRELYLYDNEITGNIPEGLCAHSKSLQVLEISFSMLTGRIPASISVCTGLEILGLGNNMLSGSIPLSLANLTNLVTLGIEFNHLTGNIPSALNHRLAFFSASHNMLSGGIPPDLGLSISNSIMVFDIGSNKLSGNILPWLGNCSNLFFMDLSSNSFNGTIPYQLGTIDALQTNQYKVRKLNCSSLACTQISFFRSDPSIYSSNSPNGVQSMVDICGNKLTGAIPEELGKLRGLQVLRLCSNFLSGPIPPSLANASSLQWVDFSSNWLSGSIPLQFGLALQSLSYFNVANNNLSGKIPEGTQFSTFNGTWFQGNPSLCGPPLGVACSLATSPSPSKSSDPVSLRHGLSLRIPITTGVALGFPVGFWTIFFVPEFIILRFSYLLWSGL